jgi:gamma-glutamylcyclotransferase (GGCT)/AIG2-like uncharacterized protein YtfP
MMTRLFVYGTLRKGSRNSMHHMLAGGATLVGQARMRGRLFDLGEYPGFVPSDTVPGWVHGELYVLENSVEMLARLDAYEGCGPGHPRPHEFERLCRDALMQSGASAQAWVYVYAGPVSGKPEIVSGDYCRPADR